MSRYWVGGTGNFNDSSHWSVTSGGVGGASVPTFADDVFFDLNSFLSSGRIVTIPSGGNVCKNMSWVGALNSPTFHFGSDSSIMSVFGNCTFISSMSITSVSPYAALQLAGGLAIFTFDPAGLTFPIEIFIRTNDTGIGGIYVLQNNLTMGDDSALNIRFLSVLDTNGKTINLTGYAVIQLTDTAILTLKASTINFNSSLDGDYPGIFVNDDATIVPGTSTINVNFTSTDSYFTLESDNANISPVLFNNVNISENADVILEGSFDFNTFRVNPGTNLTVLDGETISADRFVLRGTLGNNTVIASENPGTPFTISQSSGTMAGKYLDITDSEATGGAHFFACLSEDNGGNTGWIWGCAAPDFMREGEPFSTGVYTLGRYSKDYPTVLDLTYPISERDGDAYSLYNVEIGSILVVGNDFYVSWKRTNFGVVTYGIDKIDFTAKLDGSILETRIAGGNREQFATFVKFLFAYSEIPTGTSFTIEYSTDYGETWNEVTTIKDVDRKIFYNESSPEATIIQVRITANVLGNDSPSLERGEILMA